MASIPVTIVGTAYTTDPTAPPGGGSPPGIWPNPPEGIAPHPEHPIAPGGPPPIPTHPIVLPPGFIDGVHPEHPIVIPPPARPPGYPAHPIVIPPEIWPNPPEGTAPHPEHPIVIPPPPIFDPPRPAHPIVIPPEVPGEPPKPPQVLSNWDVVTYWTPEGGWAVALVPSATNPGVPTPSGAAGPRSGG